MIRPKTYREALLGASSLLSKHNLNPKIAEWMLLHLTQTTKHQWLEILDQSIPEEEMQLYHQWIERLIDGEPYQYILGVEEFFGREFNVNSSVLIPRPETELLVEEVLRLARETWNGAGKCRVVDIGTGSGAIAVTLALENPSLEVLAVDISPSALEVAKENAKKHGAQVKFYESDLLQALINQGLKVDMIVSNPPYIPYADQPTLERNVLDFEPHLALFAEQEGLYFYREIIKQSTEVIQYPGLLAFEIGKGQDEAVVQLIKESYPQAECQVKSDYNGIRRMVFGVINDKPQ